MPPFSVTTPIYYVNDVPHIGHAYTTIAADVLARWRRLWGDEVFFLTGTDEHGLKMAQAAEAQGLTPKDWADRTSERFAEAWKELRISNDDFIRTTEPRHHRAVQEMLQKVYDNGDIELGTYEGLYCVACEAYYTEDELTEGNCPIHGRPVERMREENYFFKLSRYGDRLLEYYEAHPDAVQPETRRNEVLGFIRQGLQDFSISRTSISWGIPIPWDPKHVAYVWFDALINYCTAMGYGSDRERFEHWWPVDYHLVGKDILRFHAVYWPAMLMAAGEAPPQVRLRPRLAAGRRREDEQDPAQPDRPRRTRGHLRVGRGALPLPAGPELRPRRRLQLRGHGRPLQRRPGQQLRQPGQPGAEHGRQLPGRGVAGGAGERAAAGAVGRRPRRRSRRAWPSSTSPAGSGRCGTSSGRPTPTSRTGRPGRCRRPATRRRWRRSSATASRPCGSWPCWPRRSSPTPPASCGAAWAWRAPRRTSACPRAPPGGSMPAGSTLERGPALFPRLEG